MDPMDHRKRARIQLIDNVISNTNVMPCNAESNLMAANIGNSTTAIATIGGQSYLVSNNFGTNTGITGNILLTLCDDNNSDANEDLLINSSLLTSMKQENVNVATQTSPLAESSSSQMSTNPAAAIPNAFVISRTPRSYRIVTLNNNQNIESNSNANTCSPLNSLNPNSVTNTMHQLPNGCEIYLIKENLGNSSNRTIAPIVDTKTNAIVKTSIKIEPDTQLSAQSPDTKNQLHLIHHSSPPIRNSNNINCNNRSLEINATKTIINVTNSDKLDPSKDPSKRSFILEAYKKRDDKRRATHNEVERRRRDKINSWIFKLKEMLPTDTTKQSDTSLAIPNALSAQQQQIQTTTTRSPPSDSKSQILIKACEYIKSMQDEIKSLRECLSENENLRLQNQRLQGELYNLHNKLNFHNKTFLGNQMQNANANNVCQQLSMDNFNNNNAYANVQLYTTIAQRSQTGTEESPTAAGSAQTKSTDEMTKRTSEQAEAKAAALAVALSPVTTTTIPLTNCNAIYN